MTLEQALERTLALKTSELQHTMTPFRQMHVPHRRGRLALCTTCWRAAWTITSTRPATYGGPALSEECQRDDKSPVQTR